MRMLEGLNKGWQVQGFSEEVKFEEVERIKEGWIPADSFLPRISKKIRLSCS